MVIQFRRIRGRLMRHVSRKVGVFLLASLSLASAQDITLRLVNAESGQSLPKVRVSIHAWNGTLDIRKSAAPKRIEIDVTTNPQGIAVFHLPQPVSEHLGLLLQPPMDFYGCWGQVFSPEKVLSSGVVADYDESKCGKLPRAVSAKPGEVVIVERKLNAREKMLREIP